MNSFKGRFFISDTPFALPNAQTFVGLQNYTSGIVKTGFIPAFGYSLFITVFSVSYDRDFYIDDGLVHYPGKIQIKYIYLLSFDFFHGCSFPNGDVYHVENGKYFAFR